MTLPGCAIMSRKYGGEITQLRCFYDITIFLRYYYISVVIYIEVRHIHLTYNLQSHQVTWHFHVTSCDNIFYGGCCFHFVLSRFRCIKFEIRLIIKERKCDEGEDCLDVRNIGRGGKFVKCRKLCVFWLHYLQDEMFMKGVKYHQIKAVAA